MPGLVGNPLSARTLVAPDTTPLDGSYARTVPKWGDRPARAVIVHRTGWRSERTSSSSGTDRSGDPQIGSPDRSAQTPSIS